MTKQDILNQFNDINFMYNNPIMKDTLSNMLDELVEEKDERIAIMQESMEAMERRLAAAESKLIGVKSVDQMAYVGWMHEDQKLGKDGHYESCVNEKRTY